MRKLKNFQTFSPIENITKSDVKKSSTATLCSTMNEQSVNNARFSSGDVVNAVAKLDGFWSS